MCGIKNNLERFSVLLCKLTFQVYQDKNPPLLNVYVLGVALDSVSGV